MSARFIFVCSIASAVALGVLLGDIPQTEVSTKELVNNEYIIRFEAGTDYQYSFKSTTKDSNGEVLSELKAVLSLHCTCDLGSAWSLDFKMSKVTLTGTRVDERLAASLVRALTRHHSTFVLSQQGEILSISFDHQGNFISSAISMSVEVTSTSSPLLEPAQTRTMKKTIISMLQTTDLSQSASDLARPRMESDG